MEGIEGRYNNKVALSCMEDGSESYVVDRDGTGLHKSDQLVGSTPWNRINRLGKPSGANT